jgi:hypothetical protein
MRAPKADLMRTCRTCGQKMTRVGLRRICIAITSTGIATTCVSRTSRPYAGAVMLCTTTVSGVLG